MARHAEEFRTEDELVAWEMQEREVARRKARVEERNRRTRAEAAEKNRLEREQRETRNLDLARQRAEREEADAENDVKVDFFY